MPSPSESGEPILPSGDERPQPDHSERGRASEPTGEAEHPLILFDGVCNLCNGAVLWVIERDPAGRFHFASLQSRAADRALRAHLDEDALQRLPDSIVLVDDAGVHTESTAAIRIARGLGRPYSLLGPARFVPTPLRDALYRFVARNRYRWFGRRDACMMPSPAVSDRFRDADESELFVPRSFPRSKKTT